MCTYQYAAFHPFLFTLHFRYLLFIFSIPFLIRALPFPFPADALVIRLGKKQRLHPSVGAGRSCQSLQRFLMIAFQMTLWFPLHTVCFFHYDEIQLERRATGHIIKTWLKHWEPGSSLETTHDNFFFPCRLTEHDRVGGVATVELNRITRSPHR